MPTIREAIPLRERLAGGKYTRWAKTYSDDELTAVLWLVGEFACRSSKLPVTAKGGERRSQVALNCLIDCYRTPMSADEVRHRMRDAVHEHNTRQVSMTHASALAQGQRVTLICDTCGRDYEFPPRAEPSVEKCQSDG